MIFYISDLHFGHANIIRHSNRPFRSVDDMDKALIENWNNVVSNNDDVYILGDISYKSNNIEHYLMSLNGRKHLIVGNHDKRILTNKRLRNYFVDICDMKTIQDGDYKIVLCHYPLVEWDGYYRGVLHFYGHIHNNIHNDTNKYIAGIKNAYNVGADILGFTPRTLQEIINKRSA